MIDGLDAEIATEACCLWSSAFENRTTTASALPRHPALVSDQLYALVTCPDLPLSVSIPRAQSRLALLLEPQFPSYRPSSPSSFHVPLTRSAP